MIRYSPKTNEQGYDVGCTWVRDVFQRFYHLQASGYDQILSGPTPTRRTQFTKDPSNRIQDQAWEHTPILRISGCNLPIFAGDLGRCSTARIYTLSIYIFSWIIFHSRSSKPWMNSTSNRSAWATARSKSAAAPRGTAASDGFWIPHWKEKRQSYGCNGINLHNR